MAKQFSNRALNPNTFQTSDAGYSRDDETTLNRRQRASIQAANEQELEATGRKSGRGPFRVSPDEFTYYDRAGQAIVETFYDPQTSYSYDVRQFNQDTGQYEDVDIDTIDPNSARPAELTDIPTSSSNSRRPYTVAAGWERYPQQGRVPSDSILGTLTVMFRDGTVFNYYQVPQGLWITFRESLSKGIYINRNSFGTLNTYPHGPADMSLVPESRQANFYKIARSAQYRYTKTYETPRTRVLGKTETRYKGSRIRARVTSVVERKASSKAGLNPRGRTKANQPNTSASRPKKR